MAHSVIAADLGTTGIQLARFEVGFRKSALLDTASLPGAVVGRPEERITLQLERLARAFAEDRLSCEELVLGLPGDALAFRLLDLPFSNPRQIESVLGYELESQILDPVDELVVDFLVVGPTPGSAGETRVLAAAAPKALVGQIVKQAQELALPLRSLGASPLGYAALLLADLPEGEAPPVGTALVVDLGGAQTTLCALRDGRPRLARTVGRGGRQLSEAVAAAFRLSEEAAEQAKRESGFVAHAGTGPMSPAQARMDATLRKALAPLLRELRQTLAAYRASYGEDVERLWLCGGGARLDGLAEHLAEELGLPVGPLPWAERPSWPEAAVPAEERDRLAAVVGLGLGAQAPTTQVNFRKGEFAYRSDFSFLRAKALHLGVAAGLVFAMAGVNVYASLRGLHKEHAQLAAQLEKETLSLFGKPRLDGAAISKELRAGPQGGQLPIPSASAFDLLEGISRAAPPADKIRLDIEELSIKPKKTTLKGTTATAQQVDDLTDVLKSKIDCFDEVQKGKLVKRTVTAPRPARSSDSDSDGDSSAGDDTAAKDTGPTELTQFNLTIKASCP